MLIICQNTEIWIVQGLFGVSTLCTKFIAVLTVFITSVFKEVLVQQVESLKRFQVLSEVLHRPYLNQWACVSWHLVNHSAVLLQQSSFPSVVVDPVSVILLALVVTPNGCPRDFVDPRLPNLHLLSAKMNVEVFAHAI